MKQIKVDAVKSGCLDNLKLNYAYCSHFILHFTQTGSTKCNKTWKRLLFDLALAKPITTQCGVFLLLLCLCDRKGLIISFLLSVLSNSKPLLWWFKPKMSHKTSFFLTVHLKTWNHIKNQCMYGWKSKFIVVAENDLLHPLSKASVKDLEKVLSDKLLKKSLT